MTEGVKNFLRSLGMEKYYEIFCAKGFDMETDIPHLTQSDLKESLMVACDEEREIILYSAKRYKASGEHFVYEWLRRNSLDHYYVNFLQSGLISLESVSNMQLPNEELYDELEILLPGHKKRLERAVITLRQEMQRRSVAEKPVTQGWWGKPRCLPQAKFDFLCVEGSLFARHEPDKRVTIDFMVDSGSDVSTVQEQKLASLNLELVGPVYSCGIHGGNHTNLYRAQLQIGSQQMTVEVIASNYDSLGSRIVRHFRHVIDGNRHIWLKGNYKDPIPAVLPLKIPATTKQSDGKPPPVLSIERGKQDASLDGKSQLINSEHLKKATVATPSKKTAVQSHLNGDDDHKTSILKSVRSLPSGHSNSSTNSSSKGDSSTSSGANVRDMPGSVVHLQKGNDVNNSVPNGIRNDSSETKSSVKSIRILSSNALQHVGSKRPLELSEEPGEHLGKNHHSKLVKLDQGVREIPQCSNALFSSPLSSSSSMSSSILPNTRQDPALSTVTTIPSAQDIPSNPASLSAHNNSFLRDTDDDIDSINAEYIYSRYSSSTSSQLSSLSSSSSSMSLQSCSDNCSQTANIQNLVSSEDLSKLSKSNIAVNSSHPSSNKSDKKFVEDIIHIHSNDEDVEVDDDDVEDDDINESVVHVIDEKPEPKAGKGGFGWNFIPGNNSSSVTISMLDLNEEDFH